MEIKIEETRINKLRDYIINVLKNVEGMASYNINVDFLEKEANYYSINRIPIDYQIRKDILGNEEHRDVYSFQSRMKYSQETIDNLKNIGFWELFERIIYLNNRKGILPDIPNILSIKCLNTGSLVDSQTNTAEFDIQIQIEYMIKKGEYDDRINQINSEELI